MKAVLDTNLLIVAFLTEGLCSGLMIRACKQAFSFVLCDDIISEFEGILKKKFKINSNDVSEILAMVSEVTSEIIHHLRPA